MKDQNESALTLTAAPLPQMKFHQLFAIPQPSQGSIYLFSPLLVDEKTGCHSILFGSLNGRFTLAGFAKPSDKSKGSAGPNLPWEPAVRDVFFAEIGANPLKDRTVEVFSLHVYQKKSGKQVFIGVTFAQNRRAFEPSSLIRTRTSTASRTESAAAAHHAAAAGVSLLGLSRFDSSDNVADQLSIEQQAASPKVSPSRQDGTPGSNSAEVNSFHIYASGPQNEEDSTERKLLAATGQLQFRQSLSFLPTHLTSLPEDRSFGRPTFLLGGSDGQVHVFTKRSSDEEPGFVRVTDEDAEQTAKFPEFTKHHIAQVKTSAGAVETSPVIWTAYHLKRDPTIGISAIGFRDGSVTLTLVDVDSQSAAIKSSLLLSHFGPILSICLFEEPSESPLVSMLVCPSLEPCLVYSFDPHQQQAMVTIENVCELPHPPSSLSVSAPVPLSAVVADVNFDGHVEILVGFCDKTVFVYKHAQPTPDSPASWSLCPECHQGISPHLPGPIHAIYYGPLLQYNSDALRGSSNNNNNNKAALLQQALSYLAVFTTSGLLIFQHDLRFVMELCKRRLQQFTRQQPPPPQ